MSVRADMLSHLLEQMERIDLLLRAQVVHARQLQATDEQFRGLYISDDEVDRLLERPIGAPSWARPADRSSTLTSDAAHRRHTATARVADAAPAPSCRLTKLARSCGLDPFEIDCLLICLAPEFDLRYERIFAYLHDDVTRKRPSIDLVLSLVTSSPLEKLIERRRFAPGAPLVRHRLVELVDEPTPGRQSLLATALKVDDRIASYLLGLDSIDVRIHPWVQMVGLGDELAPGVRGDTDARGELRRRLRDFLAGTRETRLTVVHLQGRYASDGRAVAAACADAPGADARQRLLEVDLERMVRGEAAFASLLPLVLREAVLQEAVPVFTGFDELLSESRRPALDELLRQLAEHRGTVLLAGERPWNGSSTMPGADCLSIELARPPAGRRVRLWAAALGDASAADHPIDVQGLAARFRFSAGQIREAIHTSRTLARWRSGTASAVPTNGDLYEACRLHSNGRLATIARKIVPRYRWDDIVLAPAKVQQLRELCNQVTYREQVYGVWGFERKLSSGKGLSALFTGPSGTGKTMAADIIAGELGLDLYKIDLSMVVSKYIGETEKNLSQIFAEAETSNAILFFDEADALFGKRSEVKDSHDRYANIETGYLLQRMEEHEGVVILATNLRKNLDEAFVRRLHFTVEFPFPNVSDRRRLWRVVWPPETPRDPDIDFDLLAARFDLTGGNVRNIVLAAAFFAADDGARVTMDHLLRATQRELQKMGKIVADGEFEAVAQLQGGGAAGRPATPLG